MLSSKSFQDWLNSVQQQREILQKMLTRKCSNNGKYIKDWEQVLIQSLKLPNFFFNISLITHWQNASVKILSKPGYFHSYTNIFQIFPIISPCHFLNVCNLLLCYHDGAIARFWFAKTRGLCCITALICFERFL